MRTHTLHIHSKSYMVEGYFFECLWSILHLLVKWLKGCKHPWNIVLTKIQSKNTNNNRLTWRSTCAISPPQENLHLIVSAPNSKVYLNKNCCTKVHIHTRGGYILSEGAWPMLACAINGTTVCCQKGTNFLKSIRIECRHSGFRLHNSKLLED